MGPFLESAFGANKFAKKPVEITCKGTSFELVEDVGLVDKKKLSISYTQVRWFGF